MNETGLRHTVAIVATMITGLAFYAGYVGGKYGWWWLFFSLFVVYGLVYKIVDSGHHGGGHH